MLQVTAGQMVVCVCHGCLPCNAGLEREVAVTCVPYACQPLALLPGALCFPPQRRQCQMAHWKQQCTHELKRVSEAAEVVGMALSAHVEERASTRD